MSDLNLSDVYIREIAGLLFHYLDALKTIKLGIKFSPNIPDESLANKLGRISAIGNALWMYGVDVGRNGYVAVGNNDYDYKPAVKTSSILRVKESGEVFLRTELFDIPVYEIAQLLIDYADFLSLTNRKLIPLSDVFTNHILQRIDRIGLIAESLMYSQRCPHSTT